MKKWLKDFSIPSGSAVLVDRDGTLNVNKNNGYITSPEELALLPGVPEGIARLNQIGVPVIMLTNQSAIGRGLMTEDGLNEIHAKLAELLRPHEAHIDGIFFCPHHPDDGCGCRKPNVGLIQQAAGEFSLDCSNCFLVGDNRSDLEAAENVGIPGVLVMTSVLSEVALQAKNEGSLSVAYVAESFSHAVAWIEDEIKRRLELLGNTLY